MDLIVLAVAYLGGFAALYLLQRSVLFPIPTRERVAPAAAGFPQVEEHVLTTADGERIVLWHMPAKPGRPVVLYFHGNGDFLGGFFEWFRVWSPTASGSSRRPIAAMPAPAGRRRARTVQGRRRSLRVHDRAL